MLGHVWRDGVESLFLIFSNAHLHSRLSSFPPPSKTSLIPYPLSPPPTPDIPHPHLHFHHPPSPPPLINPFTPPNPSPPLSPHYYHPPPHYYHYYHIPTIITPLTSPAPLTLLTSLTPPASLASLTSLTSLNPHKSKPPIDLNHSFFAKSTKFDFGCWGCWLVGWHVVLVLVLGFFCGLGFGFGFMGLWVYEV